MISFEPLRLWCVRNRKKQKDVVIECKISAPTVTKIFRDENPFRSDILNAICQTYGLKVDEVIEFRAD